MATMIDSKQQKLNTFEIVHTALEDAGNIAVPAAAQLAGVMAELVQPNAKVKQFGNTLFVAHMGTDKKAFVRAFNADTAANFVLNMHAFSLYAYRTLGLDFIVVPGLEDPNLIRLLKTAFANPFQSGMSMHETTAKTGKLMALIKLGPSRS